MNYFFFELFITIMAIGYVLLTIFIISCIIFFYRLKQIYKKMNKYILFCLS